MAIKVNGTTVINDSRQLQNVASVDATTVAALGAAGVGGGGTIEVTASGTLPSGDAVFLNSDGTVSAIAAGNSGPEVNYKAPTISVTNKAGYSPAVAYDGSSKILVVNVNGPDYPTATVGTVSGGAITWGSPTVLTTSYTVGNSSMSLTYDSASGKFIYVFYSGSNNRTWGCAISVSGTTPSAGSFTLVDILTSANSYNNASCVCPNTGKTLVFYCQYFGPGGGSADYPVYVCIATVSGTTVSFSNHFVVNTGINNEATFSIAPDYDKKIVHVASRIATYVNFTPVQLVGTTFSKGSVQQFQATTDANFTLESGGCIAVDPVNSNIIGVARGYTASSAPFYATVFSYSGSLNNLSGGTYNRGNSTMVYQALSSGTNEVRGLTAIPSSGAVVMTGFDDDAYSSAEQIVFVAIRSNADLSVNISEAAFFNSTTQLKSANYSNNMVCYIDTLKAAFFSSGGYAGANNLESGYYAPNFSPAYTNAFLGFTDAAYTNGQTATVTVVGGINEQQTGLTTGKKHYVDIAGDISINAGSPLIPAGVALSATKILVGA